MTTDNAKLAKTPSYEHDPVTGEKLNLIPVHKENEEGVLLIDAFSGLVQGDPMERPEWSAGLTCALVNDRQEWYTSRLGPLFTAEMQRPQAFNVEDLDWKTIEEDGLTEGDQPHDADYRMEVMAGIAGITRTNDPEVAIHPDASVGVTIARDNLRTDEEVAAFNKAQEEGFAKAHAPKTGTQGA